MTSALDIAITGAGLVAPLGHDPATLFAALCAGQTAIGPVVGFDPTAFPCRLAAMVSDFDARRFIKSRRDQKLMMPAVQLGMAAVSLAILGPASSSAWWAARYF